jgi:branched-chain amino acid transport system permease protein
MTRYADQLPLVATPGSGDGSIGPTEASRYLYGAAIVVILLYAPDGLHGLARRIRARLRGRPSATGLPGSTPPSATTETTATTATTARAKEHTP